MYTAGMSISLFIGCIMRRIGHNDVPHYIIISLPSSLAMALRSFWVS